MDEGARTERQGRPSRRRLVRSSRRRAGRAGDRRDGRPGALSRRRPRAQRPAGEASRSELASPPCSAGPLVKAGKIKAYAIIGRTRFAGLPDLPTLGEARLQEARPRFLAHAVRAQPARRGRSSTGSTPRCATRWPTRRCKKTFADGGMDLFPAAQETPEAAGALLKSEIKLWGDVIRANNITCAVVLWRYKPLVPAEPNPFPQRRPPPAERS